jgi:hypothetical protein
MEGQEMDWKRLVQFALLGSSDLEQYAILLVRVSLGLFFAVSGANKLIFGCRDGTGQNAIAEFGSEAYDLALNGFSVVFGVAVRNMTVGPSGISTRGSSTGVEERLLAEQNEWFVG